ncbi:MAG: PVC-type heme-binding CxxCH protein, partial [Planctomycetaceae bacterium]
MSKGLLLSLGQNRYMDSLRMTVWSVLVSFMVVGGSVANSNVVAADRPGTQVSADKPKPDNSLETDQDFAKRLPRIPARSPSESLASLRVRPGFRVELVASEPLIRDPVALEFDARGRMYVVELPQYNAYALKDVKWAGSVRLVVDRDADGHYDTSTVFLDGLKYPTAVTCFDGGVFVGDAPDLLYAKDTDGDGRADIRRVVYTGFGSDKAGEAHLNSFRWSFDNRIHLSTNLSGGDVRWLGASARKAVSVRSRGLIFDPRNPGQFELTSGGGQHGLSMDDWGRKFVCSNSVPAQTLMYDDRYAARNPLLAAPKPAVDIAPQGKFTKLYRISPTEPWRALRTYMRSNGLFRGSDEGGKPFGFFTGATGITIYRGSAWPDEMRGNVLVGDVANNLVYCARLQRDGLRLVAHRADPKTEFLASSDIWFRPVQMAHGPDGALYVTE